MKWPDFFANRKHFKASRPWIASIGLAKLDKLAVTHQFLFSVLVLSSVNVCVCLSDTVSELTGSYQC